MSRLRERNIIPHIVPFDLCMVLMCEYVTATTLLVSHHQLLTPAFAVSIVASKAILCESWYFFRCLSITFCTTLLKRFHFTVCPLLSLNIRFLALIIFLTYPFIQGGSIFPCLTVIRGNGDSIAPWISVSHMIVFSSLVAA